MNKTKMDCISLATITRFMKAAHILATQFGWGILLRLVVKPHVHVAYAQDTFRAVWGWQILFAPERIPAMVQSMLQDYKEVLFDLILFNKLNTKISILREDGCPCGRISLVRNIRDHLRSPLDTGTQRQTLWLAHTPTR
jgi:hypothetical protein